MTITELEKIVRENRDDLEADAEISKKTYVFMTCKDEVGVLSSAGTAVDQANMAMNLLKEVADRVDKDMVLEGIKSLMLAMIIKREPDEMGDGLDEKEDGHEKVVS